MADKIKFLKVRKVKSPNRAYQFDAGIDFFVPEFNTEFIKDLKEKNPLVFGPAPTNYSGAQYVTGYMSTDHGTLTMNNGDGNEAVKYDLDDDNDTLIKFDEEKGENYFLLNPHSRIMIPGGIKSRMAEPGRALIAGNKSGIATKHGIIFGAQIVDYTYKGEIHISVINTGTKSVRIYENMKMIQFVETPVFNSEVECEESLFEYIGPEKPGKPVSPGEEKFYKGLQDDRKDGGFGSTNKKQ